MKRIVHSLAAATALVAAHVAPAYAGSVSLTLTRTSFTNVTDAAGLWDYETGTVMRVDNPAGQYEIERRVSTGGSDAQNTAAERITFFLASATDKAPENIVLLGAYSYNTGAFNGSVAATSAKYAFMRGADVTAPSGGSTSNVLITWLGAFPFATP